VISTDGMMVEGLKASVVWSAFAQLPNRDAETTFSVLYSSMGPCSLMLSLPLYSSHSLLSAEKILSNFS